MCAVASVNPRWSVGLALVACFAAAQIRADVTVLDAGYASPVPLRLAPGQVVTLFVRGLKNPRATVNARGAPLPESLGGVTVTLQYSRSSRTLPAPILAVEPLSEDAATAVTVQIPFELKAFAPPLPPPVPGQTEPDGSPVLIVSQEGSNSRPVRVFAAPDNIHILNLCDDFYVTGTDRHPTHTKFTYREAPCMFRVVKHSSGDPVSFAKPAESGETVIAYAVGLGNTNKSVRTGYPAPAGASPIPGYRRAFQVCFQFKGSEPAPNATCREPLDLGLTKDFVGLYHVDFKAPDLPKGTPDCTSKLPGTNVAVTLIGPTSRDRADLCVQRRNSKHDK